MAHYDSRTPKRHYCFGNTAVILGLDKGILRKWKPNDGKKVITARHYHDKQGKKRYQGTASLKATENPGCGNLA